jgi:hypothetical protein
MRKSTIAVLTLSAALGTFAGQVQAGNDGTPSVRHRVHDGRRAPRIAETTAPYFRVPAYPAVRDCVHVSFPQCGARGYNALNDGVFPLTDRPW